MPNTRTSPAPQKDELGIESPADAELARKAAALEAARAAAEAALAAGRLRRRSPHGIVLPSKGIKGDHRVGIVYDSSMELHVGPDHKEQPQRTIETFEKLDSSGLTQRCTRLVARKATDEELLRCHTAEHIESVELGFRSRADEVKQGQSHVVRGADLYMCKETPEATRMAAGCCSEAVQRVLDGTVERALAVVRPPGHHAECERAMGFCFYNNVAVAVREGLQHPGIERVLVLDWDVHHGNGIQEMFWDDPNVLYISLHRDPSKFYPFHSGFIDETGGDGATSLNINVPWIRKGIRDADYMAAFDLVLDPIIGSFSPDLVVVAAGYDAAEGDPLGGCNVTPRGFAAMTQRLMKYAGGKIVLALEGGYNCRITAECAASCVTAMLDNPKVDIEDDAGVPFPSHPWPYGETGKVLTQVAGIHSHKWPALLAAGTFEEQWEKYLLGIKIRTVKI